MAATHFSGVHHVRLTRRDGQAFIAYEHQRQLKTILARETGSPLTTLQAGWDAPSEATTLGDYWLLDDESGADSTDYQAKYACRNWWLEKAHADDMPDLFHPNGGLHKLYERLMKPMRRMLEMPMTRLNRQYLAKAVPVTYELDIRNNRVVAYKKSITPAEAESIDSWPSRPEPGLARS